MDFGFLRKGLLLHFIESIFCNKESNIETHLHLVIEICKNFLLSDKISTDNIGEQNFREKSALFLGKISNIYRYKYPNIEQMLYNSCIDVLISFVNTSPPNHAHILNGIALYISLLSSNFLTQQVLTLFKLSSQRDRFMALQKGFQVSSKAVVFEGKQPLLPDEIPTPSGEPTHGGESTSVHEFKLHGRG